ncbi:MAG: D-alanyl-D-alanine endopeptidase [Burkholderiaceae bacterium]|nr:D-alanyl-D-alanine endopeptidase [Burkholderiaceae bacterium]
MIRLAGVLCAACFATIGVSHAAGDARVGAKPGAKPAASQRASATAASGSGPASRERAAARVAPRNGAVAKGPAVKTVATRRSKRARAAAPEARGADAAASPRVSVGQAIGLHSTQDPLELHSSVALVIDQRSGETLFAKNSQAVLPIASITKLMTALVVLDAGLPLDEPLEISEADLDTEKGTRSRLRFGTRLTRGELMQLALMASENRAAHALGRHFPGGIHAFVAAMNDKADALGMRDSYFVDPTGLSSRNVSNARDLARLVDAAYRYPQAREYSTATQLSVANGSRQSAFRNTNRLIISPTWDIGLQKTGYISEAGNCLVMQVSIEGRPLVLVLLDATGRLSRFGDAQRLRNWLENDRGGGSDRVSAVQVSFGS